MVEIALLVLAVVNVVFGGWWWWRRTRIEQGQGQAEALEAWGSVFERRLNESLRTVAADATRASARETERELRTVLDVGARATRAELAQAVATLQATLLAHAGEQARTQNEQLRAMGTEQQRQLAQVRETVEQRLVTLQEGNERRLEQMRLTVDEKLQDTLEKRLGESFKHVAERLEQVHKGLGEMQGLARDVGSLNRVLTNVKTRGSFGEVQLAALLEQVFAPDQYAANVETLPGSGKRVEFAVKLPGRREDGPPVWLPIDAKFPREDYERLQDAQERADPVAAEQAAKALERRLLAEAQEIRTKYVGPPHTTDVAILFLPTEGLYAEALRRPGLVDTMQREHRVSVCGPTTLHATLTALHMGFRTLALERRSTEVWEVLGAVKTEFDNFGRVLAKTKKKLDEAQHNIDEATRRTRVMTRELRAVEALPEERVQALFGPASPEPAEPAEPAEEA
ncbi:MAG TPA: DNA recombination protein RmuC [Burkholderiaceae bacterium]|jgi:DNA recombination protein RmuC|nr:DNA recombination protein RmuC [Burkholderiaceae bacterium]